MLFCHKLKHSALPLVLAGPALSKFACFPTVISTGIDLFYWKRASSLPTLLLVQAYNCCSWRGNERTKTFCYTIATRLAVAGPDEI